MLIRENCDTQRIKMNPEKAKAIQSTMLKSAIWFASLILLFFLILGLIVFLVVATWPTFAN